MVILDARCDFITKILVKQSVLYLCGDVNDCQNIGGQRMYYNGDSSQAEKEVRLDWKTCISRVMEELQADN